MNCSMTDSFLNKPSFVASVSPIRAGRRSHGCEAVRARALHHAPTPRHQTSSVVGRQEWPRDLAASEEMHTIDPPPPFVCGGSVTDDEKRRHDIAPHLFETSSPSNIKSGFIVPPPTTETAMPRRSAIPRRGEGEPSAFSSRASPTVTHRGTGPGAARMSSRALTSVASVRHDHHRGRRAQPGADAPPMPPPPP